jgi:hypothetical protein
MAEHKKILDCDRKTVLGLPSAALHLWMCYWMNEDDDQESFVSIAEIEAQTPLSRSSIIRWTHYLLRKGWLVDTGKTAADKLMARGRTPSRGAHQVPCYRVDDPASKGFLQVSNLNQCQSDTSLKNTPVSMTHKVSGSGSGSGSDSGFCSSAPTPADNARGGEQEEEKGNGKTKTQTNGKTKTGAAADGTPWPEGFDSKWNNLQRTNWLKLHDGSAESQAELSAMGKQLAGRQTFDDPFFD